MIGQTISHYRIFEKLGGGGMGVVYRAQDLKLDRAVALKFLPPELTRDPEAKERFIHEAKAASALQHNNVCSIHDIDETPDGQMFIVMDCYEGETLKKKIERGALNIGEAVDIAIQAAQGLAKAHDHGIVHRDVKPANIMLTNDGVVKIVDFGLAKLAGRTVLTKSGSTVGTVAYMSPEQARGEAVDYRTDIWSLGVTLYEMLTGERPFKSDYEQALVYSILNENPKPMSSTKSNVPAELERIVQRAMMKNPEERYQRMDEIVADLQTVKEGGKARRVRFSRRTKRVLYGAAVAVVVIGAAIGLYFSTRQAEVIDSLAVLPLQNLSGDPNQEWFSDSMTDALITELQKIKALSVRSLTSAMHYKKTDKRAPEIARELNVKGLVEGTVVREGERVRITVQLIEGPSDRHRWAKSYERDMSNILALQSEVGQAIAREIKIAVTTEENLRMGNVHEVNPKSHEAYLKGRYYLNQVTEEGMKKAIEYLNEAIEKDPQHALVYAGLAEAYGFLGGVGMEAIPAREGYTKSREAALKALEIDESVSEAHAWLADVKAEYDWDFSGAEKEYRRALELNPNSAQTLVLFGQLLCWTGRHEEAVSASKRAVELDPLTPFIRINVVASYFYARRYDEAIEEARKVIGSDPNFWITHGQLGMIYEQKGMFGEAIVELEKAVELSGENAYVKASLGHALALAGKRCEALKIIEEFAKLSKTKHVSAYYMARIYAGLGEKERAFAWLEKAYGEHSGNLVILKVEPTFDDLRSDARFTALLKKIGLEK